MKLLFIFLSVLLLTPFISAELDIGYNTDTPKVIMDIPDAPITNLSFAWVNASRWWDTVDHGPLDRVGNIILSWITPSDYDMTGYTLTTSYLAGVGGTMDVRADPWWLSGTSLVVDGNISASEFHFDGGKWVNLSSNEHIDGSVAGLMMTNPPNQELPHMVVQSGGASQASYIMRSLMIVDEIPGFHNTTNRTSCVEYMNEIGETLQIDCNTTTTGADLLVSDDFQVVGDVWIKDSDGEWHFMTRELQLLDENRDNTLISSINVSIINGNNLTIAERSGNELVVNLDEHTEILNRTTDSILLTEGTNETPVFNHVYYENGASTTLEKSTSQQDHKGDVAMILLGDGFDYGSIGGSASQYELTRKNYFDSWYRGEVYQNGFDINVTSTEINISEGAMWLLMESRIIDSNHSTSDLTMEIHSDGTFHQHYNDLDGFDAYSTGEAISNNKYFNLVCGIAKIESNGGRMYCMVQDKPSNEHTKLIDAETDTQYVDYFPSNSFIKKLYTPVVQVVIKRTGGTNTIQDLTTYSGNYIDLRGRSLGTGGSPPTPGITALSQLTIDTNYEGTGYNITASYYFGDGSLLTGISTYNVTYDGIINWTDGAGATDNFNTTGNIYSENSTVTDVLKVGKTMFGDDGQPMFSLYNGVSDGSFKFRAYSGDGSSVVGFQLMQGATPSDPDNSNRMVFNMKSTGGELHTYPSGTNEGNDLPFRIRTWTTGGVMNTDQLHLASSGKVGIGRVPITIYDFEVEGDSYASNQIIAGGNLITNADIIAYGGDLTLGTVGFQGIISYNAPSYRFEFDRDIDVSGSTETNGLSVVTSTATDTRFQAGDDSTAGGQPAFVRYHTTYKPTILFNRAKGTVGTPTNVGTDGDGLGAFQWRSYYGGDWRLASEFTSEVDGAWTTSDYPTKMIFKTTPDGSSSRRDVLRLREDGDVEMPYVYNSTNTSANVRDLWIQDDGTLVYISSSIDNKENVKDAENTDWIYNLNVKDYDYKDGMKNQTGMVAEEVELINPNLISYERNITYREECENETSLDENNKTKVEWFCENVIDKIETTNKPETINYGSPILITSMIKEMQVLKDELDRRDACWNEPDFARVKNCIKESGIGIGG